MLTDKMKATLEKKFVEIRKDKMSEVGAMVKSEWKMLFSQKKPSDASSNLTYYWPLAEFKELCAACEGKSQLMFIIKGSQGIMPGQTTASTQQEYVLGSYCASSFPSDISTNW